MPVESDSDSLIQMPMEDSWDDFFYKLDQILSEGDVCEESGEDNNTLKK